MRILHVLSYSEQPTGSSFYCRDISREFLKLGHTVFISSDKPQLDFGCPFFPVPISNRSFPQRLKNIRELVSIIRKNQIDIIHAHSRAASWVSYFAAKITGCTLVSAIHGRQHMHLSTFFNIYGDALIAVSKNIYDQLTGELRFPKNIVHHVPNGIDLQPINHTSLPKKLISIVGRTSNKKGEILGKLCIEAFHDILREFPEFSIAIVGGPIEDMPLEAVNQIKQLQAEFPNRLLCQGFRTDIRNVFAESSVIIGAGRVAIEALYHDKPTIAMGEAGYIGLVSPENYSTAAESNFGDIDVKEIQNISPEIVITDLNKAIRKQFSLKEVVSQSYSSSTVALQVLEIMKSARMKRLYPKHIPVLMYHKVSEGEIETKNRIFVSVPVLREQFSYVKSAGYTPITFTEYSKFRDCIRPMKEFPKKPVFLTFDDGYEDNHRLLFPLLQEFGFRCVIFVLGDRNITNNYWDSEDTAMRSELLSDSQVRELSEWGVEIASHSLTHPHLPSLDKEQAEREIISSKENIEKLLGKKVITFCYPYGDVNEDIKKAVKTAGYTFGISTDTGGLHLEDDTFQIFRAYIFPHDRGLSYRKKCQAWYRQYYFKKRNK
ncbi:MAG: polysaccharide deacetylase family protein [Ignavibacteria bacterium]|nr:polysaccharide deacetylase family protein [Ignavibacteria bacterium]